MWATSSQRAAFSCWQNYTSVWSDWITYFSCPSLHLDTFGVSNKFGPPLSFRAALILHNRINKLQETLEILVHIDKTALHSYPWREYPVLPHWGLRWLRRSSSHDSPSCSRNQFETIYAFFFYMKHHIAGRSHQKMDTLITSAQKCARKKPSSHIPHTSYTTRSPNCWDKAGWIHDFMSFMWNSDRTIHRKTSRLIRLRNVFPNCSGRNADFFFLF